MKRKFSHLLAFLLVFAMLITALPLSGVDVSAAASSYYVGDYVKFGSYPQSRVTDGRLISMLNSLSKTWVSYGCYYGDNTAGSMEQGDFMEYADVTYNGNKYRAVYFSAYKGETTINELIYSPDEDLWSNQYGNGYYRNNVYWFKYEPLQWRVLDPSTGLVMCEKIIDAQPYCNTMYSGDYNPDTNKYENGFSDADYENYASNYATSSIRKWLNSDFSDSAFSSSEKSFVFTSILDNSAPGDNTYGSVSTKDKVFLLSESEAKNSSYGFSPYYNYYDTARCASSSDYAKSQGLWRRNAGSDDEYKGYSYWWLRTAAPQSSYYAYMVRFDGNADYIGVTYFYCIGVRPAIKLDLNALEVVRGPVTGLTQTDATSTSVTVKWNAVSGAKSYAVYKYNASAKKYQFYKTTSSTNVTIGGLSSNSDCYIRIATRVDSVEGEMCKSVRCYTAPAKVTGLNAATTASSVTLSWDAVPGATKYHIYRYYTSIGGYKCIRTVTSTSAQFTGLSGLQYYTYKVKSARVAGGRTWNSTISDGFKVKTQSPGAVTGLKMTTANATTVSLSWDETDEVTAYRVYKYNAETNRYDLYKTVTTNSVTVYGLRSGCDYYIRVAARVGSGTGAMCKSVRCWTVSNT